MIQETPAPTVETNGKVPTRRPPRRPVAVWRRPRILVAGLGVLLVVALLLARLATPSTPPPAQTASSAALIAHGQITPARQARVGTQAGGVVQQLNVSAGAEILAQTPLASVVGPSGTEVIVAPFSGSVTNIFVHQGDTLAPAATIAVVADMRSLHVETNDVDEFLITHVGVGQVVQVSFDALDNETMRGTVSSVAMLPEPTAGNSSTAYPVAISLERVPSDARAGMSVRVTFQS